MKILKRERFEVMDKIVVGENIKLRVAEENVGVVFVLVFVLPCW